MQRPPPDALARTKTLLDTLGSAVVGDRLRRARIRMGLSIRSVADDAGLSKTSIVRLEAGAAVRASTVLRVCEAMGLHVNRLADLSDDAGRPFALHRAEDDRWVDMADAGGGHLLGLDRPLSQEERARAVAEGARVPLCLVRSRLAGGRVLPSVLELYGPSTLRSHQGEEFVYVLSGRLRIEIGDQAIELAEGESVTFWSAEPHRYAPADPSDGPTRVLSVRTEG